MEVIAERIIEWARRGERNADPYAIKSLRKGELAKAAAKSDYEGYAQLEKQLVIDRTSLQAELEEKKEKTRQRGD